MEITNYFFFPIFNLAKNFILEKEKIIKINLLFNFIKSVYLIIH